MPGYWFHAVDGSGDPVYGEVQADTPDESLRRVAERGLTPIEVTTTEDRNRAGLETAGGSRRFPVSEQVSLLTEVSTLLAGGVSVSEVLASIAEAHVDDSLGPVLEKLDRDVRSGVAFSDAMSRLGIGFPPYVHALCKAGEASGNLASALADASRQLDYERRVGQEVRSALLYPAVLVTAGTVAVLIIFVAVVPRFASLLKSSRADIPELSRWVIEAGIFMRDNLSSFAALGAGVTLLVVALLSSPLVRGGIHEVALRTPLLGTWLMKVEVGRWATVLGSLVANRVSLLEAMNLAAAAVSSRKMEKDLNDAAKGLQRGSTLAEQLRGLSWFPPTRVNLIRVGERSGELPRMLSLLGSLETEAARVTQARVISLVEPAAILLIGAVIALIMVAVMMAITGLSTTVG